MTIPFERTFPKVDDERSPNSVYCGCGWPQHMLLPKGNVHGFSATLFVMVSDFDLDKVISVYPNSSTDFRRGIELFRGYRSTKATTLATGPLQTTVDSWTRSIQTLAPWDIRLTVPCATVMTIWRHSRPAI